MLRLLLAIMLVTWPALSRAEVFEGTSAFSAFAGEFFDSGACGQFLYISNHAERPIMPILDGTFDFGVRDPRCVATFMLLYAYKPHAVQVHLYNGAGQNKHKWSPGDLFPGLTNSALDFLLSLPDLGTLQAINRAVVGIRATIEPFMNSNTTLILSTGLESRRSQIAENILVQHLRGVWPYLISGNPTKGGHLGPVDILEIHGNRVCPTDIACIANEDGAFNSKRKSLRFAQKNKNAWAYILWDAQGSNGRGKQWTPHDRRTFRYDKAVDHAYILAIN